MGPGSPLDLLHKAGETGDAMTATVGSLAKRAFGQAPVATVRFRVGLRRDAVRRGNASWLAPARDVRPIFVLSEPRTGSGLLGDLLTDLDGTSMIDEPEVLQPNAVFGVPGRVFRWRALEHIGWSLAAQAGPRPSVKLHLVHLDRCRLTIDDLADRWPDARYVVTYRRSLGSMYISDRLASRSGEWKVRDNSRSRPRPEPVVVDRVEVERFIADARRRLDTALVHPAVVRHGCAVAYEDLASDRQRVLDDLLGPALGVPSQPVPPARRYKMGNYELADVVSNFLEVEDRLNERYEPPGRGAPSDGSVST